jgi:hypothetical protein
MSSISILKSIRDTLVVLAMGIFGTAFANGPVSIGALPGSGSILSDTDTGNGQAWGRAGGRTAAYHVGNPGNFGSLTFGILNGTNPSLAFDGAVTPSTGEIMSYTAGQSNLASGMVRFTGIATLVLANGSGGNIPTRFTMTVTRLDNTPIALQFDSGGVSPGANVLASGDFKVNLLFEMLDSSAWGGDNLTYRPVLDLYDSLATIPGQLPSTNTGPVMTGVNTGLYYTDAVVGMTLEEHDAHIAALLGPIGSKINFINDDWVPRWNGLQGDLQSINTQLQSMQQLNSVVPTISQIAQNVQTLLGTSGGPTNIATKNDVDGLRDMLMTLWGINPCPLPAAQCAQIKFIQNLSTQASVDGVKVDTAQILIGLNNANTGLGQVKGDTSQILIGLNNANIGLGALDGKVNALSAKVDDLQDALDNVGSPSLEVRAISVDAPGSKQLRWIVKITRDGALVNASLSSFATFRSGGRGGHTTMASVLPNATVVTVAPGLLEVTLDLVKNVSDGSAYFLEASLASGGATVVGNLLVPAVQKDN